MKSKILFSTGAFGILLMIAGQLSFAVNDTYVKLAVKNIEVDNDDDIVHEKEEDDHSHRIQLLHHDSDIELEHEVHV